MQNLDKQVVSQALAWLQSQEPVWLCTVLATFGSSPREPGSLFVARGDGQHLGSLSGGCVEEDFLEQLCAGRFDKPVERIRYGAEGNMGGNRVTLPCGGSLSVLVERLAPSPANIEHLQRVLATLDGQTVKTRRVMLSQKSGGAQLLEDQRQGARVHFDPAENFVDIRVGPVSRLIIAGVSSVSVLCAEFASAMGFEVIVCDPREEVWTQFAVPGVRMEKVLPSVYIAAPDACHHATAIVGLTHDPRIDDLAMIEAVRTSAFYIGVMGSHKTSKARAERLQRSGGLSAEQVARLHMPIGLALGSKTPAEIALAVMADILRVQRGIARDAL
ncbi:XdhC family protein [Gilvimarinus algae]|uniref:XdhC family protein n=1 Tax=Gilvimarinus algae TaxID=3058037 RepID=A0ABT8TIF4_9GAMM|nr:XdhC family protein [Gilvimarinus sp. SDUM040014]MDO3383820.1 XdhC family protein [Gilvimarinus sp. SDUM040014]